MSFSLYSLMEARKFNQLPQTLQDIITKDEERQDMFQEKFLDYDDKDRWICIRSAMDTCLERALYQERAFYHVLFLQEVRGETIDDDWIEMIENDCDEKDIQKMNCGTQTEPIAIQTDEPMQVVEVPTTINLNEEPRKRKTRQKYACSSEYRCSCCKLNLASDGSLHNHYKSKLHTKGVRKMLSILRGKVLVGDKFIVNARHAGHDPDLSWEIEEEEDIDYCFGQMEKYLDKGHEENPITDVFLRRAKRTATSTGERITWSAVMILSV